MMRPEENTAEIPDVIEVVLCSSHELDWVERKGKIPTVVSKVYVETVPVAAVELIAAPAVASIPVPTDAGSAELNVR